MTERPADTIREAQAKYDSVSRPDQRLQGLIASGRLKPAEGRLLDLGKPPEEPYDLSISEALREQRAER